MLRLIILRSLVGIVVILSRFLLQRQPSGKLGVGIGILALGAIVHFGGNLTGLDLDLRIWLLGRQRIALRILVHIIGITLVGRNWSLV